MLPSAVQLLGTPTARMWKGSGPVGSDSHEWLLDHGNVEAQVLLLPTPVTDPASGNGHARDLGGEARLLPTPMVGSSSPAAHGQISGQFRDAMDEAFARWGSYAPAIARWESVTGRLSPAPTTVSSKGNAQLSAAFVEWMMGLPAGWVTDVPGITRNEALKALGNGVVPQQATHALRVMLRAIRAAEKTLI